MFGLNSGRIVVAAIFLTLLVACSNAEPDVPTSTAIVVATTAPTSVAPEATASPDSDFPPAFLIQLAAPLDDPDHYCIDVRGFGSGARLQDSL
jgi:hypothetical protein